MSGARFTLRLATGEVVGPVRVHGRGGEVGVSALQCEPHELVRYASRKMAAEIRLVTAGRDGLFYHPKPGHVRAYFGDFKSTMDEEVTRDLDIRGAKIVRVEPSRYDEEQAAYSAQEAA